MKTFLVGIAFVLASVASVASAAPVAADWTSTAGGTLNGVGFSATGLAGVLDVLNGDLFTGPSFTAAPVGVADALQYGATSDWTVTFDTPVNDLMLLVYFWRGSYIVSSLDPTSTYTFSQPFSILSGLAGASVAGNTLSLPDVAGSIFYSGVILFSGATTTLSVDATALNVSGQGLSFAVDAAAIPEPGSAVLLLSGLIAGIGMKLRRLSSV